MCDRASHPCATRRTFSIIFNLRSLWLPSHKTWDFNRSRYSPPMKNRKLSFEVKFDLGTLVAGAGLEVNYCFPTSELRRDMVIKVGFKCCIMCLTSLFYLALSSRSLILYPPAFWTKHCREIGCLSWDRYRFRWDLSRLQRLCRTRFIWQKRCWYWQTFTKPYPLPSFLHRALITLL